MLDRKMLKRTTGGCLALLMLLAGGAPLYAADKEDALLKWLCRSNAVYSPQEAAENGSVEQLQRAVQAEPLQVNAIDELGRTALHLAAPRGNAELIKILLEAGADATVVDADGKTPAELADDATVKSVFAAAVAEREREIQVSLDIKAGKTAAVEAALADGVRVNALNEEKSGTLLSVAVHANKADMVKLLLAHGADASAINVNGKSVLHVAAARAGREIVQLLLAAGANPMHPGNNGATPLHDAIWEGNSAAVEALIPAYAEVNFSPDGRHNGYPIGMAIMRGRADYVQLFINAGINLNDKRFCKMPLLHTAASHDRVFIVNMLLQAGADRNAVDSHGKKAVEYAKGEAYELLK